MINKLISMLCSMKHPDMVSKKDVAKCFDDVDWTNHTFTVKDVLMSTSDGCTHFYKVHSIDKAIKKLNELLKQ